MVVALVCHKTVSLHFFLSQVDSSLYVQAKWEQLKQTPSAKTSMSPLFLGNFNEIWSQLSFASR